MLGWGGGWFLKELSFCARVVWSESGWALTPETHVTQTLIALASDGACALHLSPTNFGPVIPPPLQDSPFSAALAGNVSTGERVQGAEPWREGPLAGTGCSGLHGPLKGPGCVGGGQKPAGAGLGKSAQATGRKGWWAELCTPELGLKDEAAL